MSQSVEPPTLAVSFRRNVGRRARFGPAGARERRSSLVAEVGPGSDGAASVGEKRENCAEYFAEFPETLAWKRAWPRPRARTLEGGIRTRLMKHATLAAGTMIDTWFGVVDGGHCLEDFKTFRGRIL